jgi:acyl-CoA reductase-like NAD-dependent aldehyde dehydrogenase
VSKPLEAGLVWVNRYNRRETGVAPGGYEQSGSGRERNWQTYREYRQMKTANSNVTHE